MSEAQTEVRRWIIWHPDATLLRIARWLAKAVNREGRPILEVIARMGDTLVACDGYRMHAIKAPKEWPNARYVVPRFVPTGKGPLILEEAVFNTAYPQFDGIFPDSKAAVATIAVNPRLLRDALDEFMAMAGGSLWGRQQAVIVRLYGDVTSGRPIELMSTGDEGPYVLVMPMHVGDPRAADLDLWRPTYQEEPAAPELPAPAKPAGEGEAGAEGMGPGPDGPSGAEGMGPGPDGPSDEAAV